MQLFLENYENEDTFTESARSIIDELTK